MAIGMKSWVGSVLGGMALVAVVALPPRAPGISSSKPQLPEQARFRELSREVRVAEGILARRALSDSLAPIVAAAGVSGLVVDGTPGLMLSGPGPVEPLADSAREAVERALRQELANLSTTRRAAVGVVLRPRGAEASLLHETYAGSHGGTPYCLRVISGSGALLTRGSHVRTREGIDVLGACRFVAGHGLPGTRILAWLEAGGIEFASAPADGPDRPAPGPFAGAASAYRGASPTLDPDRCLAGRAEACAAVFMNPVVTDEVTSTFRRIASASPAVGSGTRVYRSVLGAGDDYLVADLEAAFGPERFGAFWRSEAEVPEAFESAFGVPVGTWVSSWTRANIGGSHRPGPALPSTASTGALVLIVLSGLIATAAAARRRAV